MKKIIVCLALSMLFCFTGCGSSKQDQKNLPPLGEIMDYTRFSPEVYLKPFWYTREIYNETVMFVGQNDTAKLLYEPEQILSVLEYGLQSSYEEGKDYIVEKGSIRRGTESSIPFWQAHEYYRATPDAYTIGVDQNTVTGLPEGKRYLKYGEGDTFTKNQIAVTYTTNCAWKGPIPVGKSERFSNVLTKLQAGEETKLLFYGDSITTGCNASGTAQGGNVAPYMPSFPEMVCDYLENKFKSEIVYINTAVGGKDVNWGQSELDERVIAHSPDLIFIGFGMNDGKKTIDAYRSGVQNMIDSIHTALPNAEVVLLATMLPNYEADSGWNGNQKHFASELLRLEQLYDFAGVANITEMHRAMFDAGKRYRDVTGNNINHPNDFVVRLYAQVILKTLLGQNFVADGI